MKSFLAVTLGAGLLAAASTGAVAACASHVTADAPMTPIVTADTSGTDTAPVATPDKKS
ncbi:hypothetical protein [Aurantimonas coralicida]|uniref:Lipoprotein n=1 Tax=Aurantimonas coralicida TaxID=182270 RepID=A0A0P0YYC1_9HYPH|nr:hypothetical protein [Aurantimonas coralicida]MCD1643956.1 hypothetical protein [Aurantimonas coralicida]BAT26488.1 hypothetical protein [Aurantimonas coralicida]|tara:strand:+ start:63 stop:239 length:177 start_codon:yes stop_codon:yes gene_type:complete